MISAHFGAGGFLPTSYSRGKSHPHAVMTALSAVVLLPVLLIGLQVPGLARAHRLQRGGFFDPDDLHKEESPSFFMKRGRYEVKWQMSETTYMNSIFTTTKNAPSPDQRDSIFFSFSAYMYLLPSPPANKESPDVLISFTKEAVVFSRNGAGSDSLERMFSGDAKYPVTASIDDSGRICRVWYRKESSLFFQNAVREFLSLYQFYIPPGKISPGSGWEVSEKHPNGEYRARYTVIPGAEPACGAGRGFVTVGKTRSGVRLPPWSPICGGTIVPMKTRWGGEAVACIDTAGGRMARLHGKFSNQVRIGKEIVSASQSIFSARLLEPGISAPEEDPHRIFSVSDSAGKGVSRSIYEEKPPAPAPDTAQYSSSLNETFFFHQCDSLGVRKDSALSASILRDGKLLAVRNPLFCRHIGEYLSRNSISAVVFGVLCRVLGEAQTDEAQKNLVALIERHRQDAQKLLTLINAIVKARHLADSTETALWRLADADTGTIRSAAESALSLLAHCLPAEERSRKQGIVENLLQRMEHAGSPSRLGALISLLGNTGAEEAMAVAVRYMNDRSPEIRRSSASALRWVVSARADSLLAAIVRTDPESGVRLEAVNSLIWREPEPVAVKAEIAAALGDSAPSVRMNVLRNLSNIDLDFPEVVKAIRNVARNDPDEHIRGMAQSLLGNRQ